MPAQANPYVVNEVAVTLPLSGASLPREKALEQATLQGYQQLLKNITPQEMWAKHSWVIASLSPSQALENLEIVEEKTTPDYTVKVNLTFKRSAIRKALTQQGIPFSEVDAKTVLVIPVYEYGPTRMLWEPQNLWRQALQQRVLSPGILTLVMPTGDIEEQTTLTSQMAVYGARDILQNMAQAYGTDTVIVLRARVTQHNNYPVLQVVGAWSQPEAEKQLAPVEYELVLPVTGITPDLLDQASKHIVNLMEERWREAGLVAADKPGRLFARYAAKSARDISNFQEGIEGLSAVSKVEPKLISRLESVFQIDFFGQLHVLQAQMRNLNLELKQEGNMWRISPKQVEEVVEPEVEPYTPPATLTNPPQVDVEDLPIN